MSKCDRVWTRLRLEKTTLTQHEIINVAIVVLSWKLACEIAYLFKIHPKRDLWVGHVANSNQRNPGPQLTWAISSNLINKLVSAKYSCARDGSLNKRLLWAFELRRPTIPLNRNMMPRCSSRSASVARPLISLAKTRIVKFWPMSSTEPHWRIARIPSATAS